MVGGEHAAAASACTSTWPTSYDATVVVLCVASSPRGPGLCPRQPPSKAAVADAATVAIREARPALRPPRRGARGHSGAANLPASTVVANNLNRSRNGGPFVWSQLLLDVRHFARASMAEQGEQVPDPILLATKLSAVGYVVSVRSALGGGGTSCFRCVAACAAGHVQEAAPPPEA